MTDTEKESFRTNKLGLRENIPMGYFIGFCFGMAIMMLFSGAVQFPSAVEGILVFPPSFWFFVSFIATGIGLMFGVKNESSVALIINFITIMGRRDLTLPQKAALIRELFFQIFGLYIDLTLLEEAEDEAKKTGKSVTQIFREKNSSLMANVSTIEKDTGTVIKSYPPVNPFPMDIIKEVPKPAPAPAPVLSPAVVQKVAEVVKAVDPVKPAEVPKK